MVNLRSPDQGPPPPPRYTGPTIPTAYDPNWQLFVNLTPAQIAWFQAQPEWQTFLTYVAQNPAQATIHAEIGLAAKV